MHMVSKALRHRNIAKLIHSGGISSQFELARELARVGIETTQATLSRDLGEMGVVKSAAGYQILDSRTAAAGTDRSAILAATVRRLLVQVSHGGTTVVAHTPPGQASALAIEIDRASDEGSLRGVLGTIAGDDCMFIACSTAATARALHTKLAALSEATTRELAPHRR